MTTAATLSIGLAGRIGEFRIDATLQAGAGPLVLVGPNGSGKTSLLLMTLGVRPVERGRIEIGDALLLDTALGVDLPVEQRGLGYVPQDYALFPHMTVRQNVAFALACSAATGDARAQRERVEVWLADLQLQSLADRRAHELSGGEKQRVALARALSVEPRALLLDEPLAALDVHARRQVRKFLADYLQALRIPTLLVTHDLADAKAFGQRIAVIEAGRIVQSGTWAELYERPASQFVREFIHGE